MQISTSAPISQRVFPPLYKPTGDTAKDRLAFIHILERLKASLLGLMRFSRVIKEMTADSKTYWMDGSPGMTVEYPSQKCD